MSQIRQPQAEEEDMSALQEAWANSVAVTRLLTEDLGQARTAGDKSSIRNNLQSQLETLRTVGSKIADTHTVNQALLRSKLLTRRTYGESAYDNSEFKQALSSYASDVEAMARSSLDGDPSVYSRSANMALGEIDDRMKGTACWSRHIFQQLSTGH
jgi:hypothetical protein